MKNPVEIWLPWLGEPDLSKRTYETRLRPDAPKGVDYTSDELDIDTITGRPFTQYAYILVDAADVEKCTARIAEKDVPERDKRFRDMLRHCRGDMTKAAEFFGAIPAAASEKSPRAAMLAAVIEQAEARLAKTHGAITAKAVADNIAKKLNAHVARAEKKAARS